VSGIANGSNFALSCETTRLSLFCCYRLMSPDSLLHLQGWVTDLRYAGSSVYSASSDKTVVCWDAASRLPLHVQCDHSSYVKALLLCKWQLWSLSKDSLHVTVADGVFDGLHQQLDLSQIQLGLISATSTSQKSRIEALQHQIQASCILLPNCLILCFVYFFEPFFINLLLQDMNLDRVSVEQQLKDRVSEEAALASASLAAAESRISSLRGELEEARESSEMEMTKLRAQLLQQQQQTMLAEADAVDARAAQAVEKLTDERNALQTQQQLLQGLHQQLQLQHEQQLQVLQVERDKFSEQSLELFRLQSELSHANEELAMLMMTQVRSSSQNDAFGA
jgi:hypothetical protein